MSDAVSPQDSHTHPAPAVFGLATLERLEVEIGSVETAIESMQQGAYGRCLTCGVELDRAVLRADPSAVRCAQHRAEQLRAL